MMTISPFYLGVIVGVFMSPFILVGLVAIVMALTMPNREGQ